jgi:hypothetical protein
MLAFMRLYPRKAACNCSRYRLGIRTRVGVIDRREEPAPALALGEEPRRVRPRMTLGSLVVIVLP